MSISIAAAALLVWVPVDQLRKRIIQRPCSWKPRFLSAKCAVEIDHLAIDLVRQRLFVAELGNDSVGIVDLKKREVIQRISGLREPQGLRIRAGDGRALRRKCG